MKLQTIIVIFAISIGIITGCSYNKENIDHRVLKEKWDDLGDKDPKKAFKSLCFLDSQIKEGMTEQEVLNLFPEGTFVKAPSWVKEDSFILRLNSDLAKRILAPASAGMYDYSIRFDKKGRVVWHEIMLHGDI